MCHCGWLQRDGIFNCCEENRVEKIKVAAAYRPNKEVPANETPREELLLRDVGILLEECRGLRAENKRLIDQNKIILEQNEILFKTLRANSVILEGVEKPNANL